MLGRMLIDCKLYGTQLRFWKGDVVVLKKATNLPQGGYFALPGNGIWRKPAPEQSPDTSFLLDNTEVEIIDEDGTTTCCVCEREIAEDEAPERLEEPWCEVCKRLYEQEISLHEERYGECRASRIAYELIRHGRRLTLADLKEEERDSRV